MKRGGGTIFVRCRDFAFPMSSTPNLFSDPRRRFQPATSLFALAVFLLVAGCNAYTVQVDSLASKGAEEAISYRIDYKKPAGGTETPSPEEAAAHLKTALSGRGFYEAPANVKPDVVVAIDYGMNTRQERRTVREAIYSHEQRRVVDRRYEDGGGLESVPPPPPKNTKTR
jgi:hypothetical protein